MRRLLNQSPLRLRLIAGALAALVPISVFLFLYYPYRQRREELQRLNKQTETLGQLVSMGVGIAMHASDYSGLAEAMSWVKRDSTIVYAVVVDSAGQPYASYDPSKASVGLSFKLDSAVVSSTDRELRAVTPIIIDRKRYGTLLLGVSLAPLNARIKHERWIALIVSLGVLLFGSVVAFLTALRVARPVQDLQAAADRIADGDFAARVESARMDEVGALARAFNSMAGRVQQSFQQLADQALELGKARDAALAAAGMKADFLATMSHEIRTPMNGVLGMLDLALEGALPAAERQQVKIAYQSAESLLLIINDILDVSRIESGKMTLETIDFDPRGLVETVTSLLGPQASAKGLDLRALVRQGVPEILRGDPGRLRQILTNLVGNAIKFTSEGEVTVRVRVVKEGMGDVLLEVEVSDTGIGISAEAQARLFQSFAQADASTTRRYGGTGLGLTISKRLVELMGGEIGIRSEEGRGSTFWFTVAFGKSGARAAPVGVELPSGRRVLVLDDNATNRTILRDQLTAWGLDVTSVASPAEAIGALGQAAGDRPFDLAILDLQMPETDGITLGRQIRSNPATSSVQLMLLSSSPVRGQAQAATEAGFAAYLPKPSPASPLFDCIATLLGGAAVSGEPRPLVTRHSVAEARRGPKRRILVAEDNAVNQQIAVALLSRLGHRVVVAEDGQEALTALGKEKYDLVLMDCQMPRLDGFEATRMIRAGEPRGTRIPILAMTANAMPGDRERCLAAGMDDYLTKPINRGLLSEALARWMPDDGPALIEESYVPTVSTADAPIDLDALQSIFGRCSESVVGYLRLFASSSADLVADVTRAVAERDAPSLARLGHTLRGSAAAVGASGLVEAAAELEAALPALDWLRIGAAAGALREKYHFTAEYIRTTWPE